MKQTELAYIAASVDGEGSISCKLRRDRRRPWLFDIRLTITNTDKTWLLWHKERIGGSVNKTGRKQKGSKQGWKLQVDGIQTKKVIRKLLPYLIIKKPQALLALEYEPMPHSEYRAGGMSRFRREERKLMYRKMKKLNRRGDKTVGGR